MLLKKYVALVLVLTMSVISFAQKAEVDVKEGKVLVENEKGAVLVDSGRKAILAENDSPKVHIENPLVEQVIELDEEMQGFIEEHSQLDIRITQVMALEILEENFFKMGILISFKNEFTENLILARIGNTSKFLNAEIYDLKGRRLNYNFEHSDQNNGYYMVDLLDAVPLGETVELIIVSDFINNADDFKILSKRGGHWHGQMGNGSPKCLNFIKVVLPETAEPIKYSPEKFGSVSEVGDRKAVTLRFYNEKGAGTYSVDFTWPQKDVVTVRDAAWVDPGEYVLRVYDRFVADGYQSPELWGELGIKLLGGGYYEEAYDSFLRADKSEVKMYVNENWRKAIVTWLGHLNDINGNRQQALEYYSQAKEMDGYMRHDQWGIVINDKWLNQRLQTQFSLDLLKTPDFNVQLWTKLQALPWKGASEEILDIYNLSIENAEKVNASRWLVLGLKLVGAKYYDQAFDCFDRGKESKNNQHRFICIAWQGMMMDIKGFRDEALMFYKQALEIDTNKGFRMRHDQFGLSINREFVEQRLQEPVTEEFLF